MIAAFSRAIAAIVGPSRSMWSRATLVIAATPPSQAWVASSRPPSPTSTSATSRSASAKWRKTTAVSSSNSVGSPWRRATRSATASTACDVAGEVVGVDGPAVDHDPLAIADQVRLGRLADAQAGRAQRAPGQGQHAALAVGARDERAADRELRVAQRVEQGPGPAQPQADAEPAAVGQRGERRRGRLGAMATRPATRHSRVSSSS